MWQSILHAILKLFVSPHRVPVLQTATEALEFGKNAMTAVRELQQDVEKLRDQLEVVENTKDKEIAELTRQETACQIRTTQLESRVAELEAKLLEYNGD